MSLDALNQLWEQHFGRSEPGKILCVGLNYRDHANRAGRRAAAASRSSSRSSPTRSGGPDDPIVLPARERPRRRRGGARRRHRQSARGAYPSRRSALESSPATRARNDVSARDLQRRDGQWLQRQELRHLLPARAGRRPGRRRSATAAELRIVQRLNGEPLQDSQHERAHLRCPVSSSPTPRPCSRSSPATSSSPARPPASAYHRDPPVRHEARRQSSRSRSTKIGTLRNPVVAETGA